MGRLYVLIFAVTMMALSLFFMILSQRMDINDLEDRVDQLEEPIIEPTTSTTSTTVANVGVTCTVDGYDIRMDVVSSTESDCDQRRMGSWGPSVRAPYH